jgi:hypothetical protein
VQLESVSRPFLRSTCPGEVAGGVADWLEATDYAAAGFDFCFGLSRRQIARLGLPTSGAAALGSEIAARYRSPDLFKLAVGPEEKRLTDRVRRSPFAPTNLRMFRQTYWGLVALAPLDSPVPPWQPLTAARGGSTSHG